MAVDERAREKMEHLVTVGSQLLNVHDISTAILCVDNETLDEVCCDVCRLDLLQRMYAEAPRTLLNTYKKARKDAATRN